MSKSNLPFQYVGEMAEYNRLYMIGPDLTTTGSYSFTSDSSGVTYSATSGGEYAELLALQVVLKDYVINADDFNNVTNAIQTEVDAHIAKELQLYNQWDAVDLSRVTGLLTNDSLCWKGQNVQFAQPSTNMSVVVVASIVCNTLRYGHYSVGFRLKSSNVSSTSAVTTIKVLTASSSVVSSLGILGTDFASVGANAYKMFYVPFDNIGQSTGNAFTFLFTSEAVASVTVGLDSIIVAPIHLANFAG